MINRTTLTGRLTKDPEIFNTSTGTPYCNFTLAVDRQFRNKNGERDADFIQCVIWRKSAENFANFTHKGALVGIDGRIQTRNYDNKKGDRVYVTEVVVDDFALLEPRRNNQGGYQNNNGYNQNPQLTPDQVPNTGNNNYQQGNQSGYNQQPQQNNGQNYQQGQLDTGQGGWENTSAGQKMNQLNNQNNGYPQNTQNGPQNNSGNQQGNYPNQQGNNAQGQQEQSQDGNQGNGNMPF